MDQPTNHPINQPANEQQSEVQSEPPKNYSLKPVTKPLPSKNAQPSKKHGSNARGRGVGTPQFRDITEDDDGYHPYADVPDTRPLFEENPWD